MSKLRLHGTSSGYTDIAPTAAAGNNTLTAPTGTGTIVIKDGSGSIGITSVQSTNANFSGTTRITSGISTTLNITTSRINTGIITTFTATNSTFAGDIDPSINGAYDIGASNKKFKQLFINNIDASAGVVTASAVVPTGYEQQLSHRNIWINGDASVAQRGSEQTSVTSISGYATGGPDRQFSVVSNHGTWTIKQGTDAPPGFGNSYEFLCTTGDGSVASDASVRWWQRFEGQNLQRFMKGTSSAKQWALSFWIKSATTGTYAFELLDYDTGGYRNCVKTYTVDAADTWEHKTIIFPADTTGAFDNDNGNSLAAEFWLVAGSDSQSDSSGAGTWGAFGGGRRAVGHTANAGASNNDYVRITGIQLEAGSHCTPYEHKTYAEELRACQRYYYLHGNNNTYSLQGTGMMGLNGSTVTGKIIVWFPTEMRTTPSASFHTVNEFRNDTGLAANDSTFGAIWADATNENCAWCDFSGGSGSNFSESKSVMVYARSGTNGKMAFSAEL